MVNVKNVAKQLFHEVIDETCLALAKQTHLDCNTTIVYRSISDETLKACINEVAVDSIDAIKEERARQQLIRKRQEEERKRQQQLALEEIKRREMQMLEEKREMERMRKEREIKMLEMREEMSSSIADEICETVIGSEVRAAVENARNAARMERWSTEEAEVVQDIVISRLVIEICKSTLKEVRKEKHGKIKDSIALLRTRGYFRVWQSRKFTRLKFKMLRQTFPSVPLFKDLKCQLSELVPNRPKTPRLRDSNNFAINPNTDASVRSPMEIMKLRALCGRIVYETGSNLALRYDKGGCSLRLCDMLGDAQRRRGLTSELTWKIAIKFPDAHQGLESWLGKIFFPSHTDTSMFRNEKGLSVLCQRMGAGDNVRSELLGSFSLVLCLSKPDCTVSDRRYWDAVRTEIGFLVESRPAVPAIPLLVVTLGWECSEEALNCELGFSLLSFSFSRWRICCLDEDVNSVLLNYDTVKQGVKFLFDDIPRLPELVTMTLRELVEDTLGKEYVLPLSRYTTLCKKMFVEPMRPAMQIRLYNFVIESLANVVSRRELSEISWPPCDDDTALCRAGWNEENNLMRMFTVVNKCKLPPFPAGFEITSVEDITKLAMKYARSVCPRSTAVISMVHDKLNSELHKFKDEIYLDESFYSDEEDMLKLFDWHSVIDVIISEHLNETLYHERNVGDTMLTCLADDLNGIDKCEVFEDMFRELDYVALKQPELGRTAVSVRPEFSKIVDDEFSELEYSLPNSTANVTAVSFRPEFSKIVDDQFSELEYSLPDSTVGTSWIGGKVDTSVETDMLVSEAKMERKLSSLMTERLSALVNEGNMDFMY